MIVVEAADFFFLLEKMTPIERFPVIF